MFQTGVFPDLDLSFLFCPFWDFPDFSGIFPICSGMVRGFSRFVLFLFLGLLRAPTRNSPERVRDTIWTFPEKRGKHPGLETPRFSFAQIFPFCELIRSEGPKCGSGCKWDLGAQGRKGKGPCTKQCALRKHGSRDTRLAEACPPKL